MELAPGHKTSIEALEAAKEKAIGSHRRMYAVLFVINGCVSVLVNDFVFDGQ